MKRKEAREYVRQHLKEYLEYQGIDTRRNFKCINPNHQDNTPSMSYNEKNVQRPYVHCFSCNSTYDIFDVIGIFNNVYEFKDKEKIAYEFFNILIDDEQPVKLTEEEKRTEKLKNLMKEAVKITKASFLDNTEFVNKAKSYLAKRKISQKAIEEFNIGIEYQNKLPNTLIGKLYYKKEYLLTTGLMRKSSHSGKDIDTFFNRLLVPIYDRYGNPVGFGGRVLDDSKPKYLNSNENEIFHKSEILFNYHKAKNEARNNEIVIVEGYFDVISAWEMGMKNVVAVMSANVTEQQIEMIKELNCEVILSLDNDSAGNIAMLRVIPELLKNNLIVSVYDTSVLGNNLKDFGDFLTNGKTQEDIKKTKITGYEFLLKHKYFKDKQINVNNILLVYNLLKKDNLMLNSVNELEFKEYIAKNSAFSKEEIQNIIEPREVEEILSKDTGNVNELAQNFFLKELNERITKYSQVNNDDVLKNLIKNNIINYDYINQCLEECKDTIQNSEEFDYNNFIKSYICQTEEYKNLKEKLEKDEFRKKLRQMPDILDNVYGFDKHGREVRIYLTDEQKELVLQQYLATYEEQYRVSADDEKARAFSKLYITDTEQEYRSLWMGLNYVDMERWCFEVYSIGGMACVPYQIVFRTCHDVTPEKLSDKYVLKLDNNEYVYKKLLAYNNRGNSLGITEKNYIKPKEPKKEEVVKTPSTKKQQKIQEEKNNNKIKSNILIPINKFLETPYGIYIVNPNNTNQAIYIDKKSYSRTKNVLMLDTKNKNDLSVYSLSEASNLSVNSRKWKEKLPKNVFLDKYKFMFLDITKLKENMKEKEIIS